MLPLNCPQEKVGEAGRRNFDFDRGWRIRDDCDRSPGLEILAGLYLRDVAARVAYLKTTIPSSILGEWINSQRRSKSGSRMRNAAIQLGITPSGLGRRIQKQSRRDSGDDHRRFRAKTPANNAGLMSASSRDTRPDNSTISVDRTPEASRLTVQSAITDCPFVR